MAVQIFSDAGWREDWHYYKSHTQDAHTSSLACNCCYFLSCLHISLIKKAGKKRGGGCISFMLFSNFQTRLVNETWRLIKDMHIINL